MSTAIAKNLQVGADPTATNNFTIYQPATPDGTLRIGNGNTGITSSLLTLTSAGNLGLGTSSPTQKLTLSGSGAQRIDVIDTGGATIRMSTDTGAGYVGTTTSNPLILFTGGSVRATLDTSGNLGLGVTPTNGYGKLQALASGTALPTGDSNVPAGYSYAQFSANSGAVSDWLLLRGPYGTAGHKTGILLQDTFYDNNAYGGRYIQATGGALTFGQMLNGTIYSSNGTLTEHARIDTSGNLLVGTTSTTIPTASGSLIYLNSPGALYLGHANGAASGTVYSAFAYNGSVIGSITQNGTTGVLYNTTSDQRLKENIQDSASASALIDSLQVRQYDWKSDGSHQRYGFIAQELVIVAPEAVHQPANPDDMMAVDYSKLVPMLVKELQSLRARVAQLEAK